MNLQKLNIHAATGDNKLDPPISQPFVTPHTGCRGSAVGNLKTIYVKMFFSVFEEKGQFI